MAISSDYRSRTAEAAVEAYRICKPGTAANSCIKAAAATDALLGTSDSLGKVTGELVDIGLGPVGEVQLGGTVTAGAWLTSDAAGKAIATTTAGNQVIGRAEVAGVLDDVIPYLRAPGQI